MSLDRLIFGWLTIILIFAASFFLFWPELGNDALKYTQKKFTSKSKPKRKKVKKAKRSRKIVIKKVAPIRKKRRRARQKVQKAGLLASQIWSDFKYETAVMQERRLLVVRAKTARICQFFRLCR